MSLLLVCLLSSWTAFSSPELNIVLPRGAQQGSVVDVVLSGKRLSDVQELLFYGPGIEVVELSAKDDKSVQAKLRVAPDCALGEHSLRLRTATGITPLRTFWVGPFPCIDEVEDNGDFAAPQRVPLNHTIHGRVRNEDIDYFAVEMQQGQHLSVEVEGMRLGGAFFDPWVAILDAQRFEQVSCDDSALLLQDPVASLIVPEDGVYVVAVRDASFRGSDASWYRLHIGSFPRPLAVYPPGGMTGETLSLRFLGDPGGELQATLTLPNDNTMAHAVSPEGLEIAPPSPNFVRVWGYPNVLEVEPNGDPLQMEEVAQELPLALNGILQSPGDMDWFRFSAKKGGRYRVAVMGRRLRSPIDSVINLYRIREGGKLEHLVGNDDDARFPDSELDFKVPEDGVYALRVRDHLSRGGPTFVYRVEFRPPEPMAAISLPFIARDSQARKQIAVPRGNRSATAITLARRNFREGVQLIAENLPAGVSMHAVAMSGTHNKMVVVFEAAPDAPLGAGLVKLKARCEQQPGLQSQYFHDVQLVIGAPNRTVYYRRAHDVLPVAVCEEAPFHLELIPPKVPLVPNGAMNLEVVVTRQEGFDKAITVRMLWKPSGIGAQSTVKIPAGKSRVSYPINASGKARPTTWNIAVLGEADAGHGTILVSSALTPLQVAEPFLSMKIDMTVLEQGKEGEVVCKITPQRPFEGKAKVRLYGLPAEATAPELEITKDEVELVFPITTTAKTPPGQHKNLFCRAVIPQAGGMVTHNLGQGGVLRVDPPAKKGPPAKVVKTKEVPKPTADTKPKKKRLTRLEKLRKEAVQAAASRPEKEGKEDKEKSQ